MQIDLSLLVQLHYFALNVRCHLPKSGTPLTFEAARIFRAAKRLTRVSGKLVR